MCTHFERMPVRGGKTVCWKGDYEDGAVLVRNNKMPETLTIKLRVRVIHLRGTHKIGRTDAPG